MCVCARVQKGTGGSKTVPGFHQVGAIEGPGVDHGRSLWAVEAMACLKVQLRVAAEDRGLSKGAAKGCGHDLGHAPAKGCSHDLAAEARGMSKGAAKGCGHDLAAEARGLSKGATKGCGRGHVSKGTTKGCGHDLAIEAKAC